MVMGVGRVPKLIKNWGAHKVLVFNIVKGILWLLFICSTEASKYSNEIEKPWNWRNKTLIFGNGNTLFSDQIIFPYKDENLLYESIRFLY